MSRLALSEMVTLILSPACTVIFVIRRLGSGMISHQAEYEALPDALTSCSVPAWISVESVTRQLASTQPPPIPTHVEENSASPALCGVAVGTVHGAETWVK